jgi:sugar lactone lactonase YvrE
LGSNPTISGNIVPSSGIFPNSFFIININCLSNSGTNYSSDFAALPVNTLWKFSDISGNNIYYTQTSLGNSNTSYYEFALTYVSGISWTPLIGDIITVEAIGLGGYLGSSLFEISARFNSDTSYYNLQTSFNVGSVLPLLTNGFTYSFSGGVSASSVITSLTYSFSGGLSSSNAPVVIAGKGTIGFSGDGGTASDAELDRPIGLAYDMGGSLYIADTNNGRLRMVDPSNIITTISGNTPGFYGPDGTFAFASDLYEPSDVAVDNAGRIYISTISGTGSDPYNVVRRIDPSGIIDAYVGTVGFSGIYSGNGVVANTSRLNSPQAICIDQSNNILYVCDTYNNRIRKVDLNTDIISDFAGNGALGFGGDGGPAINARLNLPTGVSVDAIGNVYIADSGNNRIRKVDITNRIYTVAGNGGPGYSGDGMPAISTRLNNPTGVAVDLAGNMYIADKDNNRIRLVPIGDIIINSGNNDNLGNIPIFGSKCHR